MKLSPANPHQSREVDCLTFSSWGQLLTLNQYLNRETFLRQQSWPKSSLQNWLLLSDEEEVLASCECFRMQSILHENERGHTYGIASVFTPEKNRRQGYASKLISLVLAEIQKKDDRAHATILFSDAGEKIYNRLGFNACPAFDWSISAQKIPYPNDLVFLDLFCLSKHLNDSLRSYKDYSPFCIIPSSEQWQWHFAREGFYQDLFSKPRSKPGGFVIGDASISWISDLKKNCLQILHFFAPTKEHAQKLLRAASAQAFDLDLPSVQIWASEVLLSINDLELNTSLIQRDGTLPMILGFKPEITPDSWKYISRSSWV